MLYFIVGILSAGFFNNSKGIDGLIRLSKGVHPNPLWILPFDKNKLKSTIYSNLYNFFQKEIKTQFSSFSKCFWNKEEDRSDLLNIMFASFLHAIEDLFDKPFYIKANRMKLLKAIKNCEDPTDRKSVAKIFLSELDRIVKNKTGLIVSFTNMIYDIGDYIYRKYRKK
ncbi:hypothetical protein TUBRATIS_11980 [Tubulinosema ratisbonensis]|uniref:Uncharacterized protein n=1 Tax=Tubulinosema ratisbonensis TaxID=291195 RepID=A0A437AMD1_9MICR|nr:hypothetical protein TUBRATIS_11980 [Tubulinosema ratisbonensis]